MTNFHRVRPADPLEVKLIELKRSGLTFPVMAQRLNDEGVTPPVGTVRTRKIVKRCYDQIQREAAW